MAEKITVFESYLASIERLPPEFQGEMAMMILRYGLRGVEPSFDHLPDGIALAISMAMDGIKPNISASVKRSQTNAENATGATAKTTAKTKEKATAKTTAKAIVSKDKEKDRDRDKEMETVEIDPKDQSISTVNALGDATAAKAASPYARPRCPLCNSKTWKNTQSGNYECPECLETFTPEKVVWQ